MEKDSPGVKLRFYWIFSALVSRVCLRSRRRTSSERLRQVRPAHQWPGLCAFCRLWRAKRWVGLGKPADLIEDGMRFKYSTW